jgi:GTP cyclohydrolase I
MIDAELLRMEEEALGDAAEAGIAALLMRLGEDVAREGLIDTPRRVVKAMLEMTTGHGMSPKTILARQFESDGYQDLVIVRGIRFASLCEHHLLPFVGTVAVAYLPDRRVVGLSKIPRLVECFARRLQLQERMTHQIANAMNDHLQPRGVGVHVTATHQCMACRGVRQPDADMVTTTVLGELRENASLKAEFIAATHSR